MNFGIIGVILLLAAYVILNTKHSKYFLIVDAIASFVLTIHAIIIEDVAFVIVNAFITIMLIVKQIKGGLK